MNSKDFPRSVYLDTNIIRGLDLKDTNTHFLELKNWAEQLKTEIAIPEVVMMEWHHDYQENLDKKTNQTSNNLKEIEILLGLKQKSFKLPDNYKTLLARMLAKKMGQFGIKILPTPQNISLNEFVKMAAFKIRPFEEKGEKGFRDTIILYTILEDMKNKKFKNAVFITKDGIFLHVDVQAIVKKYGVNLDILGSFDEASTHIQGVMDEKVKQLIEEDKQRLVNFVKSHKEDIFKFIKETAEISEDFITKGGFLSSKTEIFGKVENILNFEPVEIEGAFGRLRSLIEGKDYPKGTEPILISVKIKLKILYSPMLLFNRPRVKIQDLPRFKEVIQSTQPKFYGDPVEEEIIRSISIRATLKKDEKGNYSELKLENVNTF